jgi:hypothetical protein
MNMLEPAGGRIILESNLGFAAFVAMPPVLAALVLQLAVAMSNYRQSFMAMHSSAGGISAARQTVARTSHFLWKAPMEG